MGNFFQAVGNSNLSEQVGKLSNTVLQMRQQSKNERIQDIQMETERLQQTKARNELAEQEKVRQTRNRAIDVTASPMFLAFSENTRGQILKDMQASGIVDENGIGKYGTVMDWSNMQVNMSDSFKKYFSVEVDNRKNNYLTLKADVDAQVAEGKLEGEKLAKAQAQVKAAYDKYATSFENYTDHLNKLDEIETQRKNALELENLKSTNRLKAVKELAKHKANLSGGRITVGSNKEEILKAIRLAGGIDKLSKGDRDALSVITKNDSQTKDTLATKMAVKEMEGNSRYSFEKDANKKREMLRAAKQRNLDLLNSLENELAQPSAELERALKSEGYKPLEEFTDEELLLILPNE